MASANFARGSGAVSHVFHNATDGIRLASVWATKEYPILRGKNVELIFHNVFR
jgi:hypothetical protein